MFSEDIISLRKPQNAHYDKLYYATEGNKTPRFDLINPEKIRILFAGRSSYEYVKMLALERLHQTFGEQMDSLTYINHCEDYDLSEVEKMSHNVFSWTYDEFLKRRQLENCVWIDVMVRNSTKGCLEKQKAKADLKEAKTLVHSMFKAIYEFLTGNNSDLDLERRVWKPLREAERYTHLPELMQIEQEQLKSSLKEAQARVVTENVAEHLDNQQSRLMAYEDIVMNSDVWDPIEVRYEINWYHTTVKQNQYQKDLIQFGYENKIAKLKAKIISEKECGDSIMDTYYSVVEQYKRRINEFQERYDLQLDDIENKNNYIQAQIDKLRDSKKLHSQEIERFHREIQKRLAKEQREREEVELKRQEVEAAALALLEAQKLKKRKKDKAKGGAKGKLAKRK